MTELTVFQNFVLVLSD